MSHLRRFLSPQVADLLVSSVDESILKSHRREVAVLCMSLAGFTAFAEVSEPEEVMVALKQFHDAAGSLVHEYQATVASVDGDEVMVFFNDPLPCENPAAEAVKLSVALRALVAKLSSAWLRLGHELTFRVGVASGYATVGEIGFEGRFDYGLVGNVVRLAQRLGERAAGEQILINQRVFAETRDEVDTSALGDVTLPGFTNAMQAYEVLGLKTPPRQTLTDGSNPAGLSAREVEVLRLIAAGKSNQQVADELVISLNTVTHHVGNIFNKIGAANRTEAASYAHRNGIA